MLRLIILLNVLTLKNIHTRELVVSQVVQSEQIIISSSPSNQKVTEELIVPSRVKDTDTEYHNNKLNRSKELLTAEEDFTLSSKNLAVKTYIHGNNSTELLEKSVNNTAEDGINNEERVNIKPLDIISQGKAEGGQSKPGEATNDTDISLVDRSSFNGDKCPTGRVRINEQCISTE